MMDLLVKAFHKCSLASFISMIRTPKFGYNEYVRTWKATGLDTFANVSFIPVKMAHKEKAKCSNNYSS